MMAGHPVVWRYRSKLWLNWSPAPVLIRCVVTQVNLFKRGRNLPTIWCWPEIRINWSAYLSRLDANATLRKSGHYTTQGKGDVWRMHKKREEGVSLVTDPDHVGAVNIKRISADVAEVAMHRFLKVKTGLVRVEVQNS
jgi:hypothetical protein